jgi:hypothetical protein
MQDVAQKILKKCSGCMLAVSILGSVLSDTPKTENAWKKVYAQFKYYASAEEYTPHDYNGTIFAVIDLSLDHGENKMFSKDLMWSVLQALSLFRNKSDIPSCVVKLAWKSMQPEGETEYFEAVVDSLIHKNLVDRSAYGHLSLHGLVGEYVELKKPIDLVTILCDQEGELKQGMELLAVFLSIYGKRNDYVHVKVLLWRAGAVFHEIFIPLYHSFHYLLDNEAENAILAVFQLYKATQQDAKILLHFIHTNNDATFIAAQVLVWLMINVGVENLLVDGDLEKFVSLCTNHLQYISSDPSIPLILSIEGEDWWNLMLQMANCRVFAKKMICHRPLLILIVENIEKEDFYLREYVQILVALILYVQGIRNTSLEKNVLEEDKYVMRKLMKSCVLDNTCLSHVVLYHGENNSRSTEVPFFEPKFIFEYVKCLLQQYIQKRRTCRDRHDFDLLDQIFVSLIELLDNLVDITNGATHFVEYGCVELLFHLEEPRWDRMTFKHGMRFFSHKVIFESISSTRHIRSLVSILKHGAKEDIMNVPWVFKYLAIAHEAVAQQLIIEVGVEKVVEAIELWQHFWQLDAVELLLKHESIAKEMILQGTICELLTRVIHQNSKVCTHVLSNLIRYLGDIVIEDLDAKGGLRLFMAYYSMQPLNPTWIQLLQGMAQNKAFANKMVALGSIEMVADTLNHPMDFQHLISVARLVKCLVEGFEDRLDILLSKISIKDLLAIHERLSLQGILEFTFLPGAFVITKRIAMDLLASNHHKEHDFDILLKLAKSHEEIASLIASRIATNDKIMKELFSECYYYEICVELLSAKFAISREKKVKSRQI